jgi:hypothetical protein
MNNSTPRYTNLRNKIYWLHYKLPASTFKHSRLSSQLIRLSLNTTDPDKAGSLAQLLVIKLKEYCKTTLTENITKVSLDKLIIDTLTNLGEVSPNLFNVLHIKP